jgi:triacylglycerol lipase
MKNKSLSALPMPASRTRWWKSGLAITAGAIAAQELAAWWYYRRTPPPATRFSEEERTAWTPAWRELLTPLEWLALQRSGQSDALPRGDGAPVILIPGFLMTGAYLEPMRRWLTALGYDARVASVGVNADCFAVVADRVLQDVEAARGRHGRRVHLIGHSLGGVLARATGVRAPHAVASVAMMGSPVRGLRLHPSLRAGAAAVRTLVRRSRAVPAECMTFACSCDVVRAIGAEPPDEVAMLAIAAQGDGVTDWRYCIDALATRTATVRGSHMGLVFNRAVYEALAGHLAAAREHAAA